MFFRKIRQHAFLNIHYPRSCSFSQENKIFLNLDRSAFPKIHSLEHQPQEIVLGKKRILSLNKFRTVCLIHTPLKFHKAHQNMKISEKSYNKNVLFILFKRISQNYLTVDSPKSPLSFFFMQCLLRFCRTNILWDALWQTLVCITFPKFLVCFFCGYLANILH